jgi:hypothetical protein
MWQNASSGFFINLACFLLLCSGKSASIRQSQQEFPGFRSILFEKPV